MSLTSIIYFSSILLTCLLTGFLAWYAWQQPALPGVRTYAWIAASECLLTLATIFSMLSGTQAQALFWFKIRFIFSALIPALWFVLSLQYNGYKNWLSKRVMIGMFIIPIISQGMLWTNDLHGLWVRQEVTFYSNGPFWIAEISARIPGMMYMVNTVYSLILGLAGIGLMIFMAWSKSRRYRNQALLISIATLTALAAFVIPTFNLFPQNEFSPLVPGMGISSLLFAFVIFKFQFLKRPAAEEGATITRNLEPDEKKSLIRLLFVFVLFTTGFAVISYSAYQNYETQFRAQIEKQLSAIGMLKVDELQNWRQERLADASIFYQNDNFSEQVKTYLKNPQDTEARNNLLTWMKKLQAVPEYDRIFLLDPQGRERISIPAEPKAVPPNLVTQSAASLAANKIIFLDFHRHSDKDGVYLSILIPIFDGSQPLGVLVLRINPKIYLYPFIQRWPVPSQSAETLLVRQDGGDIVYLSELKFKLGAVLSLRTSLENKNIPAVKAALGFEGLTEGVDYRGVEVVGDVRAVPDSPWFLVSKIDKDEVYAPLRERMFQASLFTCLLILAVGMGLASIWRQQRVRYLHSQMDTLNALRTSDEKFKLTFDTSPDLITITRFSDGMFTSVNKGFEKNSGFTQEDVIGKTTSEVNIWKDVEDRRRLVEELQAKGEVRNYEAPLITKNGEIYGLMSASIIQLNGVPHVLTITRDITERKRAEGQIRKLSRAVEQSPASIVITDLQGNIEYANPRFTQVTGYSLEEVLGKTPRILKSGYTPDEEYKKLWEIITTGNIWQGEFLDKKKSGETYWENATITPVLDDNGKVTNFLAIKEDITERKRVGEALRESEARYRTLIENMGEGIGFVDAQEQFLFVNPAGHEIFGMPADSLAGHNLKEFTTPDQFNLMLEQTQQRLAGEKTSYEIEINRPDGKKYNLLVTAVPRFDSHGQYIGALGVFRNLTERKQVEEALHESEERFKSLHNASFGGIAIHDKGIILECNYGLADMTGYSVSELTGGMDGLLLIAETTRKEVMDKITSGYEKPYEAIGLRKNGDEYPLRLEGRNIYYKGKMVRTVEFRDITETKQAEKALRESEQKYRLLFDEMLSGVDPQGKPIDYRFIAINSAFEKMTGLISSAVIGKRVREIMPATEPNWIERYGKVALTRIPTQFEDYSVEINKYFEVRAFSPEKGKFATIFHDVTERRQAEEKLHSAHELMQSVQDSLSAHITTLDHEGNIVQVNSAWRNFGAQNGLNHSNHCIGMNYLQICDAARGVDAEEASTAAYAIREVLNGTKKEMRFEYPCHAPNEYGWFIAHITSFENNGKKWVVVSHENITERKQAEENISLRMTELELLYENSMTFNQSLNPKEIAQKVIELLSEKLDWHHTALRLFNEQDNSLELTAFDMQGLGDEEEKETLSHLSKLITHISEGLSGWAIEQGKTLRIGDVNSDPHYVSSYPGIQSGLYAPLRSGKRVMGVISIESKKPNAFSEADEQLITTLANQAGIALENARLYREISSYAEKLEQRVQERTAEIEATQRRLELAVETAGIGIWELDIKQNKDYWDDRLFALYGLSRETSEPEPETWRKAIHPDDLNEQLNLMDEALRNNQPYNTEFRVVLPNGNIRYIKSTGRVIPDATGNADRMIGANQDITIHKQAEETLSLANAEMERGLRMKNEFLANMSHELRTPLNAILGISESLEEQISGTLNEKQLGYIRTVIESGRHLLDLINDILDLSKIEAGKLDLNIQNISVEKLCTASLRMVKELAQKKSLNVSFKMDQNAQQILGDERRLKQSLVNLLGNAVKFTPSGKRIGLEVKGNAQANEITFTIWDEGIGIKQENIQRLFKPFVQLNAGLAREYAGTGLGLALVAQMVLLHGGHIDLKSELNTGSRFTITLPWMPKEQVIQMPVKHQVLEGNRTPKIKRAGKILIVDDTEVVAQLMSEYLRHKGYETLIAANGREGVMLASQEHPQVILMDVMMPIMNGLDATKKIRADASLRDIPIIGLTALAMSSDREQCLAAGMNDHISKPVEMQELVKIIERYLAQSD